MFGNNLNERLTNREENNNPYHIHDPNNIDNLRKEKVLHIFK